MSDFVGTGWAFPPRLNARGAVGMVSGDEEIKQSIWIILGTPIGQRVMRPTFGSRLHELVFAPQTPDTFGLAEAYVEEALTFWEPRIQILDVSARDDRQRPNYMLIDIRYVIKASHDERSLVYPFYRIPGE